MRSLRLCLAVSLALLGARAGMSAQDVTPPAPLPQAVPSPFPTIPSDITPAPTAETTPPITAVPTPTPTKVLSAAAVTPAPDLTVSVPKPRRKDVAQATKTRKSFEPPALEKTETSSGSAAVAASVSGPSDGPPPSAEPPRTVGADVLEPLPPPPETQAVTPAAKVDRSIHGGLSPWVILGAVFVGVAGVMVTLVARRKPDVALHITP